MLKLKKACVLLLSLVLCLSMTSLAFADEEWPSPLEAATTVKQIVNEKFIYENDTDTRLYYDQYSGIDKTDLVLAYATQHGSYVDYSFEIKDADRNLKQPTGVIYIVFPFPPTFYTMDHFKVYDVSEDETTKPTETYFINGAYVYIKATSTGTYRLVDEDYQAPFRCDLCTEYEQITNNENANAIYKYLISIIHFIVHNVTALVRPR